MKKIALVAVAAAILSYASASAQIVADGGFEQGTPNPVWDEFSENFASPICSANSCTDFFGGAFEGDWWAWFGGATRSETAYLRQQVTIPVGTATLSFHLDITSSSGNGSDFMTVSLDGQELFTALESDANAYHPWTEVVIDVSAFADGGSHLLSFDSTVSGPMRSNFFVDAVGIEVEAGLPGDLNCDGEMNAFDIEPFLLALFQPDEYVLQYPDCDINLADINSDGSIDAFDIEPFLGLLFP